MGNNTANATDVNGIVLRQIQLLEKANEKLFADGSPLLSNGRISNDLRSNSLAILELARFLDQGF